MIHFAIFLSAEAGFLLLLFAIVRHQQEWLRRKLAPARSQGLRVAGFALLALSFGLAGGGLGWGYGTVVWCGWLTVAAALAVTINTNREHILARIRA